MDVRPIGVFDSGLGGLTAVRRLIQIMPCEDIVYFGDTARVPYGTRSVETILKYTRQNVRFLRSFDIKTIVVACGTVSAAALPLLGGQMELPLIGVVEPAAKRAAHVTRSGRVGLIGTQASVRSGAYERALSALNPDIEVTANACPLLVPLVEAGRLAPEDPVVSLLLREYLEPMRRAQVDTLILGCTHYPLLTRAIEAVMGAHVTLVDPGAEAARQTALDLEGKEHPKGTPGQLSFYVSDDVESFARSASMFLGRSMEACAVQVDINEDL